MASDSPSDLEVIKAPQRLVSTDENDLKVNPYVLKEPTYLRKPLVIVAIAGPCKTGKSWLLNLLADSQSGNHTFSSEQDSSSCRHCFTRFACCGIVHGRVLFSQTGFAMRLGLQSKTTGIWIWVRNHPRMKGAYLVLLNMKSLGGIEKVTDKDDRSL